MSVISLVGLLTTAVLSTQSPSALNQDECIARSRPAAIVQPALYDFPSEGLPSDHSKSVSIRIDLAPNGEVLSAEVHHSMASGNLNIAALRVAKDNKYAPEINECRPVGGSYLLDVYFD